MHPVVGSHPPVRILTSFHSCLTQLQKQKEVVNNLTRLGHLELPEVTPIKASKEKYYYRNKMECHVEPDWLLIYEVENKSITLYRTGSHADLFD